MIHRTFIPTIVGLLFLLSMIQPSSTNAAPNDRSWGVEKGDKFEWKLTDYDIGSSVGYTWTTTVTWAEGDIFISEVTVDGTISFYPTYSEKYRKENGDQGAVTGTGQGVSGLLITFTSMEGVYNSSQDYAEYIKSTNPYMKIYDFKSNGVCKKVRFEGSNGLVYEFTLEEEEDESGFLPGFTIFIALFAFLASGILYKRHK